MCAFLGVFRSRVSESWCCTIAYIKLQDLITILLLLVLSMLVPTKLSMRP